MLGHLGINVPDLDAARSYYAELLPALEDLVAGRVTTAPASFLDAFRAFWTFNTVTPPSASRW